jgi:hypothetical protein
MEPEVSLPHLQQPATCPSRELRSTKFSVQVWSLKKYFVTSWVFHGEELLAPRPTPNLEDHPLSAVRGWLFSIFAGTLHIWWPFFYPQPGYPFNVTVGITGCCVSDWTNVDRQFEQEAVSECRECFTVCRTGEGECWPWGFCCMFRLLFIAIGYERLG